MDGDHSLRDQDVIIRTHAANSGVTQKKKVDVADRRRTRWTGGYA